MKTNRTVWALLTVLALSATGTAAWAQSPFLATHIAAGDNHSLAVRADGTVWACGYNQYGQIGNRTNGTSQYKLVQVSGLSGVANIVGGGSHSVAVKSDGTIWTWGCNFFGALGDNSGTERDTPVQVSGLSSATACAAGDYHTVALKSDGTVWAWGLNQNGRLGDGTITTRYTPVQVSGLSGVIRIAAGGSHTVALKSDGTVWAWGYNGSGQLGNGTNTDSLVPVQVSGLSGVTNIAAGGSSTVALKSDGTVWAWGYNSYGQLGDNTTTTRRTPVQVAGLSGVGAIAAGTYHTMAVKNDGTVWAWGNNGSGQLGDNTTTSRLTPVQVSGLSGVTDIAAGYYHSMALKSDATVWAWGNNGNGQFGNNTTTSSSTPVQMRLLANTAPIAYDFRVYCVPNGSVTSPPSYYDADLNGSWTAVVVSSATHGTVVGGAKLVYTPTTGFQGDDSFTYLVNDGEANSNVATVRVKVRAIGAPVGMLVDIVVNDLLYTVRSNEVLRLKADLVAEGYTAIVTPFSAGASAQDLWTHLNSIYQTNWLVGALLIGNVAKMAPGGIYSDTFYWNMRYFQSGGGQARIHDIWVGRFSVADSGYGTEFDMIRYALDANHYYRTGQSRLPQSAYVHVGSDWGGDSQAQYEANTATQIWKNAYVDSNSDGTLNGVNGSDLICELSHGSAGGYRAGMGVDFAHAQPVQSRAMFCTSCSSGYPNGVVNHQLFSRGGGNLISVGASTTCHPYNYTIFRDWDYPYPTGQRARFRSLLAAGETWGHAMLQYYPFADQDWDTAYSDTMVYGDLSIRPLATPSNCMPVVTGFTASTTTPAPGQLVTFTVTFSDADTAQTNGSSLGFQHQAEWFLAGYDYGKNSPTLVSDSSQPNWPSVTYAFPGAGTYVARVEVMDAWRARAYRELTINVNNPPVASNDTASVEANHSVTIAVLANDSDPDGALTIQSCTQPAHGTATISGNTIVYTSTNTWTGSDTFAYTIRDSMGATASAAVAVSVVADVIRPVLQDAACMGDRTAVTVTFDEKVLSGSGANGAENAANYALDHGASITAAALQPDGRTVKLTTSAIADATTYTLTVNNVGDLASPANLVAANSRASFQYSPLVSGLAYEYYQGSWASGGYLPDFNSLTPVAAGVVGTVSVSPRLRDTDFAFRYTGKIQIPTTGSYTFYTYSDDGSKLFIDGAQLVNNDGPHGMVEQSGALSLTAGFHDIVVTFCQGGGGYGLTASWQGPGISKQEIPGGVLWCSGTLANQAPTANAQSVSTAEDTAKSITLTGSDPEGSNLTYTVVTSPAHGTLSGTGASRTYTPAANYNGADSLTFKVNDGALDSAEATVSITVTAVNDAPTVTAGGTPTSGTVPLTVAFTATGADVDGDTISYAWTFGDTGTSTAQNPSHVYASAGSYTATVTVNDGHGGTASANVAITVTASGGTVGIVNGSFETPSVGSGYVYNPAGATWTITGAIAGNGSAWGFPAAPDGTQVCCIQMGSYASQNVNFAGGAYRIAFSGAQRAGNQQTVQVSLDGVSLGAFKAAGTAFEAFSTPVVTPGAGIHALKFQGLNLSGDNTMFIDNVRLVAATNQPPVANAQSVSTAEDTAKAVTLTGSDPEGSNLTYTVVTSPAHGTLSGTGASRTYTPAANYNGSDSFTFKVSDGSLDSTPATVTITVTAVNDNPTVTAAGSPASGTAPLTVAFSATGADVEGDTLSYAWTFGDTGTSTAQNPSHVYTAAGNYTAVVTVNDGHGGTASANVAITVTSGGGGPAGYTWCASENQSYTFTQTVDVAYGANGKFNYKYGVTGTIVFNNATFGDPISGVVKAGYYKVVAGNQPPVANAQSVTTAEDTARVITLTGSDPEGSNLTYTVVTQPAHGTLSGTAPNMTYTPAANYNGSDSFTFKVNDGALDSAPATVTITVTAVNDAPTVTAGGTPASGTAPLTVAFTATGADVDGDTLSYAWTFGDSGTSTAQNPSHTYTSPGSYTSYVTVSDGKGGTASVNVAITVTAPGGDGTGLKGEYFDNMDFTSLKVTRVDPTVDFDWGSGSPDTALGADSFSVRWTGQVKAQYNETYTFYTMSDDGVRLWVNGVQVINNWTDHGPTENSGTIALVAGQKYDLKMEFYENGGGAVAKLLWSSPSTAKQTVPTSQLYPAAANQAPVAMAGADPVNGSILDEYYFWATESYDPDGTIMSNEWRINGSLVSTNAEFLWTFATGGTYTVTLTVWDNAGVSGSDAVILNVSQPTTPVVSVSVLDGVAGEPGLATGSGRFQVSRIGDLTTAITVNYAMSGTASNGVDYTLVSGTVTLGAGVASRTVVVDPLPDALAEGTEMAILTLSAGAGYTVDEEMSSGAILIQDQTYGTPTVTAVAVDAVATEPKSGMATDKGSIKISRTGSCDKTLTVQVAVGGTAVNGTDYSKVTVPVVLSVGQSAKTLTIVPLADAVVDPNETVILTIQPNAAYAIGVGQGTATVTIRE